MQAAPRAAARVRYAERPKRICGFADKPIPPLVGHLYRTLPPHLSALHPAAGVRLMRWASLCSVIQRIPRALPGKRCTLHQVVMLGATALVTPFEVSFVEEVRKQARKQTRTQTNKNTNKQAHKQTSAQTSMHAYTHANKQEHKQTNKQAHN